MLWLILAAFVAGVVLGINQKLLFIKKLKPVSIITVLLLFFMGYEIGSDAQLVSRLPQIGIKAFLTAVFAIAGSVLFTTLYDKMSKKGDGK
jgi:uncharacterized membrane protein YbjE (DUF340 family)